MARALPPALAVNPRTLGGACLLATLVATAPAAARSDFDAATGRVTLPTDALRVYGFETPASLVGLERVTWADGNGFPVLEHTPITKPEDVVGLETSAPDDVLEGSHGLRLGGGKGVAVTEPALFAELAAGRFEVLVWGRADGAPPQIQVSYDLDPEQALSGFSAFAQVRAVRTGRQTSDGWAEYGTGPLDGTVFAVPARAVIVAPSPFAPSNASFLLDALEIRKVSGRPVAPVACTQATVDQVCGAEGDCMFGRCVSSTVTWGVLPPPPHRAEIAERWAFWSTRLIGDRRAAINGKDILAPEARRLAAEAKSSREFFGGMTRLVNLLRDNHTSFGSPANFSRFAPQLQQGTSSLLGACFGLVEKDIAGGGLGFAVFKAAGQPASGVPLQVGDVVTKIDGQDPKSWVDANWPRFATALPNDPASDWGSVASDLSRLVVTRASNVTLLRCGSPSSCTDESAQTLTIDIGELAYKAVTEALPSNAPRSFVCSPRFTPSVKTVLPESNDGNDPVSVELGEAGETRVQFDGFVAGAAWRSAMTGVFSGRPSKVLMDAREGHGGLYDAVDHMLGLLRGKADTITVLSVGRGATSLLDPPWLFDRVSSCTTETADNQWACFVGASIGLVASAADPPGASTKVAWVNTHDVSANDYMPRLLKGRAGFRVFGPHPTAGAFGAIVPLPPVAAGWSGGSIQIQDSRFAVDAASLRAARWESGNGVAPDEVVVQKLSDALAGTDTLLAAASAWLAIP
jgi:hypothetical protein